MTKNKITIAALSALTVLMTSSAFADESFAFRPGHGRPDHGRPDHGACARAQQNLRSADHAFRAAAAQLYNAGRICGGSYACIQAAQNHYNRTLSNLQYAQAEYNRACR